MVITGLDIYVDQLRYRFNLPERFDIIPGLDFFPPQDDLEQRKETTPYDIRKPKKRPETCKP